MCDTKGCARDTEVATSRSSESTEDRWGETPNSAEVQLQRSETPGEREGTKDLRSKPQEPEAGTEAASKRQDEPSSTKGRVVSTEIEPQRSEGAEGYT